MLVLIIANKTRSCIRTTFAQKLFFPISTWDLLWVRFEQFRTVSDVREKFRAKISNNFERAKKKSARIFFRTFEIVRNALRMNVGSKFAKKVFVRKLCDATSEQNAVHSFQIILLPFHLFRLCLHRMSLSCLSVFVQ